MAQELKELIEKIQQEGIKAAEEKARQIESRAQESAAQALKRAKDEAERIILEAKEKAKKTEDASKASIAQAGRNLLISLRQEIGALLNKIIVSSAGQELSGNELAKILHSLIIEAVKKDTAGIVISVSKEDVEKIEKEVLSGLKEEIKKGISLKAKEDIASGFLISFDAGKSHFDFTDEALASYISQYLKPELGKLLKGE